jgi:hypothetical protein
MIISLQSLDCIRAACRRYPYSADKDEDEALALIDCAFFRKILPPLMALAGHFREKSRLIDR